MTALLANRPAEPAVMFAEEIADLMIEAKNYLDGEPIANAHQAEAVSAILNRARRISNDADDIRKAEKKPHDDAGKEVQARWKPILDAADLAASTAKQALAPWLVKLDDEQRVIAETARAEAERMAAIALEARHSASGNLTAAEDAERLTKAAVAAGKDAARADKAKPLATGGERAVGLRSTYRAEITDPVAFGKWAWEHCRPEYLQFLTELAIRETRHGPKEIPGLTVHHERLAR